MRKSKYTAEVLEPIVASSKSMAEVFRKLGLRPSGGNHRMIGQHIAYLGIDKSHFTGARWNAGETSATNPNVARIAARNSWTDSTVFSENSSYSPSKLDKRLRRIGWEYECHTCRLREWQGKPITLHVDHINGTRNDHRLENLQFLCPNCHQQTSTWGNKKKS